MRKIKFRGWGVDTEMMHDLESVQKIDKWWEHGALVLMQFTGLLDSKGKEIYEGDIIKTKWGGIGKIEFDDGTFVYLFEDGKNMQRLTEESIKEKESEIIGNIYENPELLAVK